MERVRNFTKKTFSSLKIRNYRLYFFGQAFSQIGTWMQTIAQNWLILKLTGSGIDLGLMSAAQFLPVLILGPFAGALVDRFDKRKIIFFTQGIWGVLSFALAILVSTNTVEVWMVFLISFLMGVLNAIDTPARHSFMYEIVGKDQITNAISLNSSLYNLTRIIGPSIAGIIIVSFGLAPCFYINAVSFVAIIIGFALMKIPPHARPEILENIPQAVVSGLKYVANTPQVRDVLIYMLIIGTFVFEFAVSVPLLAEVTFKSGALGYSWLTAAMGVGSLCGGLYSASRTRVKRKDLLSSIALMGFTMFAVSLAPNIHTALIVMVILGFSLTSFSSRGNSYLQINTQPEMRGRVLSFWNTAFIGSTPIGGPIIGWVSQTYNPRWGFVVGAVSALFTLGYGYLKIDKKQVTTA